MSTQSIPDLLLRAADELYAAASDLRTQWPPICEGTGPHDRAKDADEKQEIGNRLRTVAECFEKPTEEMVEAAMGHASAGCHGVSEEGEKMRSTCESWMIQSIIAAIAAAGDGL